MFLCCFIYLTFYIIKLKGGILMRRALIIDDEEAVLKIITHFIEMKDMPIKLLVKQHLVMKQ